MHRVGVVQRSGGGLQGLKHLQGGWVCEWFHVRWSGGPSALGEGQADKRVGVGVAAFRYVHPLSNTCYDAVDEPTVTHLLGILLGHVTVAARSRGGGRAAGKGRGGDAVAGHLRAEVRAVVRLQVGMLCRLVVMLTH